MTLAKGFIQKIGSHKGHPEGVEDIGEGGEEDPVVEIPGESDGPREGADAEDESQRPPNVGELHSHYQLREMPLLLLCVVESSAKPDNVNVGTGRTDTITPLEFSNLEARILRPNGATIVI